MDSRSISRKGAIPGLAALARAHPKPLSAKEWVDATGMDAGAAIRLREEFHIQGLIDARVVKEIGTVRELEIRLTALGRDLATRPITEWDDILRRDAEKRRRA